MKTIKILCEVCKHKKGMYCKKLNHYFTNGYEMKDISERMCGQKKLNIGAGTDIKEGYINHDQVKLKGIDVVFDLNKFPYPYKDNTFHEIRCVAVLEHTKDIIKVMKELNRILQFGGKLVIEEFPHFTCSNAFADPTHRYFGAYGFFDLFEEGHKENYYAECAFFDVEKKICFGKRLALWNLIIEPLANAFPQVWENTFLRNMFPAESISVVMIK